MPIIITALTAAATAGASAGIRHLIDNQRTAKDYEDACGVRPFFTGERRDAYNDCVNSLNTNSMIPPNQNNNSGVIYEPVDIPENWAKPPSGKNVSGFTQTEKILMFGGIALGAVILYKIATR